MSAQGNAALAREIYALFNDRHFDQALEHVADDAVAELHAEGLTFRGRGGFRDGKMVEHWRVTDELGMMQQLGVIPAPEEAQA